MSRPLGISTAVFCIALYSDLCVFRPVCVQTVGYFDRSFFIVLYSDLCAKTVGYFDRRFFYTFVFRPVCIRTVGRFDCYEM